MKGRPGKKGKIFRSLCEQCGTVFPRRGRGKYCSDGCKQKAYRARREARVTMREVSNPRKGGKRGTRRGPATLIVDLYVPKRGQRMGHLLGVGKDRVRVRLLGPEAEVVWIPTRLVVGRYAPGEADAGPGGIVKLDEAGREAFLEAPT